MAYLLLADDDEDFVAAVTKVMRSAGHEIKALLETGGVIEEMVERRPDLLILDVMFPEDSSAGFDLARKIEKHEQLKGVPVLMLTGVNQKFPFGFGTQDIDENWLPVSDFLEKPVDFDVLKDKVSELLEKGTTSSS